MDYTCPVCHLKSQGVVMGGGEYVEIQCGQCGEFLDEIDSEIDEEESFEF